MTRDLQASRSLKIAFGLAIILLFGSLVFQVLSRSSDSAETGELRVVQSAVITMMVDNRLKSLLNPVVEPTREMRSFPDATTAPETKGLASDDKPGYVLYGHDNLADGNAEGTVNYMLAPTTIWEYTVTSAGLVIKSTGDGDEP